MGLSSELGEILLLFLAALGASGRSDVSPTCRLASRATGLEGSAVRLAAGSWAGAGGLSLESSLILDKSWRGVVKESRQGQGEDFD